MSAAKANTPEISSYRTLPTLDGQRQFDCQSWCRIDPKDIVEALKDVKANVKDYQRKAIEGSRYVLETFSPEKITARFQSILTELEQP